MGHLQSKTKVTITNKQGIVETEPEEKAQSCFRNENGPYGI